MVTSFLVAPPICWMLREDDPAELVLPSGSTLSGAALIHPLHVQDRLELEGFPQWIQVDSERRLYHSCQLDFRATGGGSITSELVQDSFLPWIRFVSGQPAATRVLGQRENAGEPLVERRWPIDPDPVPIRLVPRVEATALTFAAMRAERDRSPSLEEPTYADVLLDAIDAGQKGDYRKSILYAAIAVEVMASTVLDETVAAGTDPVRDHLRRSARREFRVLLHELPLYLMKRSLLVEDEGLYQRLICLHGTRNEIAHTGEVDRKPERLPMDYAGMKLAVHTAIDAFTWFGAQGRYFPGFAGAAQ